MNMTTMISTAYKDGDRAKTYGLDPFVRFNGPIRVYVSHEDSCLHIRQDDQEIVLSRDALFGLCKAFWLAFHAHDHGIRGEAPGYGEEGYVPAEDDETYVPMPIPA